MGLRDLLDRFALAGSFFRHRRRQKSLRQEEEHRRGLTLEERADEDLRRVEESRAALDRIRREGGPLWRNELSRLEARTRQAARAAWRAFRFPETLRLHEEARILHEEAWDPGESAGLVSESSAMGDVSGWIRGRRDRFLLAAETMCDDLGREEYPHLYFDGLFRTWVLLGERRLEEQWLARYREHRDLRRRELLAREYGDLDPSRGAAWHAGPQEALEAFWLGDLEGVQQAATRALEGLRAGKGRVGGESSMETKSWRRLAEGLDLLSRREQADPDKALAKIQEAIRSAEDAAAVGFLEDEWVLVAVAAMGAVENPPPAWHAFQETWPEMDGLAHQLRGRP